MKKYLLYFLLSVLYSPVCFSQTSGHLEPDNKKSVPNINRKGIINISAGVGASLFVWYGGGINIGEGSVNVISHTTACNFTADYNITSVFSLGIAYTYESMTDNPYISDEDYLDIKEIERITRHNIAGRMLFHFGKRSHFDSYSGVRIGASIWTDQILSMPPSIGSPAVAYSTLPSYQVKPSVQVLYGFIYYVSSPFGLHFETGIGTPYFLEFGVTFKLNTRKN